MAEISIIVPVYNSERYLEVCLNSILNQTFKEFEVICVDDASEDSSREILLKYQQKDPRINIKYHKKRKGAANARNYGLECASAPFVVFWDADEIYVSDFLEKAYDAALKYNADLTLVERGTLKQLDHIVPESSRRYEKDGYDREVFSITDLSYDGLNMWSSSPMNRLIKRHFIDENRLRYQDLKSSNDVLFADMTMLLAKRIIHINDWEPKIYIRRNIPGSISMNRDPFCSFQAFKEIKNQLQIRGRWDEFKIYVINHFIMAIKSEMLRCNDDNRKKQYYEFLNREGIEAICERSEIDNILSNTTMGIFLRDFLKKPYEMRIWERSQLWMQLEDNRERVERLINYFVKNNLKVTLWGAGKWGKDMLIYCRQEFSYNFFYLVDNNKELVGSYIEGKRVSSFLEVKDMTDLIIITNLSYKKDIKRQIKLENPGLKLFSLPQYLGESIIQCID